MDKGRLLKTIGAKVKFINCELQLTPNVGNYKNQTS